VYSTFPTVEWQAIQLLSLSQDLPQASSGANDRHVVCFSKINVKSAASELALKE
jgi:hypothetical protein